MQESRASQQCRLRFGHAGDPAGTFRQHSDTRRVAVQVEGLEVDEVGESARHLVEPPLGNQPAWFRLKRKGGWPRVGSVDACKELVRALVLGLSKTSG